MENKEWKIALTQEHYCAITFYHFKAGLNQEVYRQRLYVANENLCYCWFKEFYKSWNSLLDDERAKRTLSALVTENVSVIRKILTDDNDVPTKWYRRDIILDPGCCTWKN